jgi:hypothetical protein
MPQTPFHLYRTTDASGNSFESEVLQDVKDWRDANAPGEVIYDITIATRVYFNVTVGGQVHSFPDDINAAIAFRDEHAPGTDITTHLEDYEVEPYAIVQE